MRPRLSGGHQRDVAYVALLRSGDPSAFGLLFDTWIDPAYDRISHRSFTPADVTELSTTTFAATYRRVIQQATTTDPFRVVLFRAARQEAVAAADRRVDLHMPVGPYAEDRLVRGADAAGLANDPAVAALLWQAADVLGEQARDVLDLRHRHDFSPEEIAAVMDLTPESVDDILRKVPKGLTAVVRAMVVWRQGTPNHDELAAALAESDGFDTNTVRTIAEHQRSCESCRDAGRLSIDPLAVFAAIPIASAPVDLKEQVVDQLHEQDMPIDASVSYREGGASTPAPATGPAAGPDVAHDARTAPDEVAGDEAPTDGDGGSSRAGVVAAGALGAAAVAGAATMDDGIDTGIEPGLESGLESALDAGLGAATDAGIDDGSGAGIDDGIDGGTVAGIETAEGRSEGPADPGGLDGIDAGSDRDGAVPGADPEPTVDDHDDAPGAGLPVYGGLAADPAGAAAADIATGAEPGAGSELDAEGDPRAATDADADDDESGSPWDPLIRPAAAAVAASGVTATDVSTPDVTSVGPAPVDPLAAEPMRVAPGPAPAASSGGTDDGSRGNRKLLYIGIAAVAAILLVGGFILSQGGKTSDTTDLTASSDRSSTTVTTAASTSSSIAPSTTTAPVTDETPPPATVADPSDPSATTATTAQTSTTKAPTPTVKPQVPFPDFSGTTMTLSSNVLTSTSDGPITLTWNVVASKPVTVSITGGTHFSSSAMSGTAQLCPGTVGDDGKCTAPKGVYAYRLTATDELGRLVYSKTVQFTVRPL